MRIGIVGWGVEGQSVYNYFGPEHEYLIVNEEPRDDFPHQENIKVQFIGKSREPGITSNVTDLSYLEGIGQCDKTIYTPTSYKNLRKAYGDEKNFWAKATTAGHIFFEQVKTKNIIGVTGSKGKGTTSSLIAKMLEADGKKVFLGGNIGTSVLDFVKDVKETDWIVIELANFQLHEFPYSPHIAVCLMITPEHMDWHPDMAEYKRAKANIFKNQKPSDIAIYYAKNELSKEAAQLSPGKKIPYYEPPGAYIRDDGMIMANDTEVMPKTEVILLGEHNLQNICAALTAFSEAVGSLDLFDSAKPRSGSTSSSLSLRAEGLSGKGDFGSRANSKAVEWVDKAKQVLHSFSGLEHRLELVRAFEGIKYYDDSFATTPDSAIVALQAFKEPKVVILGGHDKGLDFAPLAKEVANSNVRHVIAVGGLAGKIAGLLKTEGFTNITLGLEKMPDIVEATRAQAKAGDVVLLSTGSSSFGLFKDYKDRGKQFKQAVLALF